MAPRFTWLAFVTTSVTTSGAMKCPGSPSWVHASAQVEAMADGTCQDVIEEIQARVAGNEDGSWHDPHNGGQYSLLQACCSICSCKPINFGSWYSWLYFVVVSALELGHHRSSCHIDLIVELCQTLSNLLFRVHTEQSSATCAPHPGGCPLSGHQAGHRKQAFHGQVDLHLLWLPRR